MNDDQRRFYNEILASIQADKADRSGTNSPPTSRAYFLDAPGGCGKTYLLDLILDTVRSWGDIVTPTASSGIAALLLPGGMTAHSKYGLSLNATEPFACAIKLNSPAGQVLQASQLHVLDEAPMLHRHCHEAIDTLLRDLLRHAEGHQAWRMDHLFGGKTFILSGDFRQILPVIRHGTAAEVSFPLIISTNNMC